MIRTIRPLPNNIYAMLGVSAARLIHVNEDGNVAILWFKRHSSGVGLSIERFGRFNGIPTTHSPQPIPIGLMALTTGRTLSTSRTSTPNH